MGKSNQKTVKVVKEPCDKKHYYAAINLNALTYAAGLLSGDGFKMWIYFSKNQPDYKFELSSKHAEETFSLSKRRYDNAIKELTENGFLVDTNTDPKEVQNRWTFYELPLDQKQDKPLQQNDTSLIDADNKPCLSVDTRNNTDNTNNTHTLGAVSMPSYSGDISTMTEEQKKQFFELTY